MTVEQLSNTARCFEPFIDPIDGVVCLSADAKASDIDTWSAPHRLRFPLIVDPNASLREQIEATSFAPASSRFGPYCDNVLGMNWELPNGHVVRIGERVVKTTTGYDVFRFLLHSGIRYGRPLDYVLRLRPDCGCSGIFRLSGPIESIGKATPILLQTSWMHWFDSIDFVADKSGCHVRIAVHCPAEEWTLFESFVTTFSTSNQLRIDVNRDAVAPTDGCPDLVLKTTPEHVLDTSIELLKLPLAHEANLRCVGLCHSGVVHCYISNGDTRSKLIDSIIQHKSQQLIDLGGDWHSRHRPPSQPSDTEAEWIRTLVKEAAIQ